MTEQKIEAKLITAFQAALAAANVTGVNVVGVWQTAASGDVKGEEHNARGYLTVKVSPRAYATFTQPEATFAVAVRLDMRADEDETGASYLAASGACSDVLCGFQKSFATYNAAMAVADEFRPTGFTLDGGDCGVDSANGLWTWMQNANVQGIVLN